ncbi:MAG TPA: hypothetical protein VGG86_22275 [Roseiarcus sp.]|jgi:hypothetical protein
MDVVELPLVPGEMPLGEAFGLLKANRKSGLVVDHVPELVLLQTSDLTHAWNSSVDRKYDPRARPVGSIPPRRSKVELPNDLRVDLDGVTHYADMSRQLEKRLRHVFDQQEALDDRHVILRATLRTARVFTSSEGFTARLGRSSVTCTCTGPEPDVHTFTKDQVNVKGQCNYPHRAGLTCDDDF